MDDQNSLPPLNGLLVLDLSRVLAAPYATMILGDLGAEVIKVERPGQGDDTRQFGPPWAGGEAGYFLAVNRNKKSITLNLKHQAAREIVSRLASQADVLIENYRVGTMDGWGIGYQTLCELNPRLIYCAVTGYGQTGPYRERPGYDFVIQAEGGIMSVTGPPEGPPSKVGVPIVDLTTGMLVVVSILAALHERERSGLGQYVDMALLDAHVSWLANAASNYLVSGKRPKRYGNAHPNIAPYEPLPTADGWIAVGVGNDRQWGVLNAAAGWDDLANDERFATNSDRVQHREILIPILEDRFREHTSEEWQEILLGAGIPCSPIQTVDQVFSDPQVLARQMLVEMDHPSAGKIKLAGSPFKFSRTPVRLEQPPPLLGQHTDEVLSEILGYTPQEIERLRDEGAI